MSTYVRGSLIGLRNNSSDEENNLDTPLVDNSYNRNLCFKKNSWKYNASQCKKRSNWSKKTSW